MTSIGRSSCARAAAALALAAAVAAWARSSAAAPAQTLYSIVIGQNDLPVSLRTAANQGLAPLRYADDDAVYFYTFLRDLSRRAYLLSVLDADTQRRYPGLASQARVPTRAELAATVEAVRSEMEADRRAGREPVLLLFYSGHGVKDERGAPALALHDGGLARDWLYDQVRARLPALFIHVIVDAGRA